MLRGRQTLFNQLFDEPILELPPAERKGRNEILIAKRNEIIICRYYYYAKIEGRRYRSLSFSTRRQALAELRAEFSDTTLLSVPGFIATNRNAVSIVGPSTGLVVPVRDVSGRIVALKVRRDNGDDHRGKYALISGGGGPSCGTPTHVPLGIQGPVAEVRITEGELKSDVAAILSGVPTIGFPVASRYRRRIDKPWSMSFGGAIGTPVLSQEIKPLASGAPINATCRSTGREVAEARQFNT